MSSVLIVDDEPGVRTVVRRWTESLGHTVREAGDAEEALASMAQEAASVVICDISMPGHDGLWLVEHLRSAHPNAAIVMATAMTDVDAALVTLHQGVVDYLVKPFDRAHLRESLAHAIDAHRESVRAAERLSDLDARMQARAAALSDRLSHRGVDSDAALEDLLIDLTAEERPLYEHGERVAQLATSLSLALGAVAAEQELIGRAARVHDLYRLALPEGILSKTAALCPEEREILKRCVLRVSDALAAVPFLRPAAELVRSVHERVDGTGYPWGLRGREIPFGARIISVADAFDTMTHPRIHRDAKPLAEALFELRRNRGTQLDGDAVDALLRVVEIHRRDADWREPAAVATSPSASGAAVRERELST